MAKRTPCTAPIPYKPTFDEVRDQFQTQVFKKGEGVYCPCCDRWMKVNCIKLNKNMVRFLDSLVYQYRTNGGQWVHYTDCKFRGRDYNMLKHWGLAEMCPNTDPKKRKSGYWRPTESGIDFIDLKIVQPSHAYVCKNEVEGYSKHMVTALEASGFDYSEMMASKMPTK